MVSFFLVSIMRFCLLWQSGVYHINPKPKKKFLGMMTVNEETESRLTTRKGTVDLSLSIGGGEGLSDTVDIKTGSREGDVTINLVSVAPSNPLGLTLMLSVLDFIDTRHTPTSGC